MTERGLLQTRLLKTDIVKLKEIAKKKGVSLNALMIFIIQEYIERNK